jgi:hypothetical protein
MFQCANDLDVDNLKKCIGGTDGLIYLSGMGNKTSELKPQLQSVPAIAVNMVRKQQQSLKSSL